MSTFDQEKLPALLFNRLQKIGFTIPTPVQEQTLPHALEGKDILGSAQTGTGKTGAFGIPLIAHLMENKNSKGVVLLPTRELAAQVARSIQAFIDFKAPISSALLIGGESMGGQMRQLRSNPQLIIGTPGRVNDHLERGTLDLSDTTFFVLDEVDRMLDMGFEIQLDAIFQHIESEHQTLMFSATLPRNIERLAAKYLNEPVRISIESTHVIPDSIKQENVKISQGQKQDRLLSELEDREGSVIVFVKMKKDADQMARLIKETGHRSNALHGDLRQSRRNQVIAGFRKKQYRVLVATDVAARGLDIPHIEHVINYDLPQSPEDYVHRIGRTGRTGGMDGQVLTFISPSERGKWNAISRLLDPATKDEDASQDRRRPSSNRRRRFSGNRGRSSDRFGNDRNNGGFRSEGRREGGFRGDNHNGGNFKKRSGGFKRSSSRG